MTWVGFITSRFCNRNNYRNFWLYFFIQLYITQRFHCSLSPCAPPVTCIFLRYSFNNKLTEWLLLKMASFQENCFVILVFFFWLLFKTYVLLVIGLFRSQELRALFASDLSRTFYLFFFCNVCFSYFLFCFFHKRWEKLWGWCLV